MNESNSEILFIGSVCSELTERDAVPRQGYMGAPSAWVEIFENFSEGLNGISKGDEILVITWLHEGDRRKLRAHPNRDEKIPKRGVFSTRTPNRPNPIGIHRVKVLDICSSRLRVYPLEAINGTPVVDIKPTIRLSRIGGESLDR